MGAKSRVVIVDEAVTVAVAVGGGGHGTKLATDRGCGGKQMDVAWARNNFVVTDVHVIAYNTLSQPLDTTLSYVAVVTLLDAGVTGPVGEATRVTFSVPKFAVNIVLYRKTVVEKAETETPVADTRRSEKSIFLIVDIDVKIVNLCWAPASTVRANL